MSTKLFCLKDIHHWIEDLGEPRHINLCLQHFDKMLPNIPGNEERPWEPHDYVRMKNFRIIIAFYYYLFLESIWLASVSCVQKYPESGSVITFHTWKNLGAQPDVPPKKNRVILLRDVKILEYLRKLRRTSRVRTERSGAKSDVTGVQKQNNQNGHHQGCRRFKRCLVSPWWALCGIWSKHCSPSGHWMVAWVCLLLFHLLLMGLGGNTNFKVVLRILGKIKAYKIKCHSLLWSVTAPFKGRALVSGVAPCRLTVS